MKNFLLSGLLSFCVLFGQGQDMLHMVDGRVREVYWLIGSFNSIGRTWPTCMNIPVKVYT